MLLRAVSRVSAPLSRSSVRPTLVHAPRVVLPARRGASGRPSSSLSARNLVISLDSSDSHAETYESFNARYVEFFNNLEDPFELMRGLNNCFIYDLVPSQEVIEAALRAARRCNDYAIAVRIFDALKDKVDTKDQYKAYVRETEPLRKELGLLLADDLYERDITWRTPYPGP